MNMSDWAGGALGVCMCSLQVARECGELLPVKVTWGRVVYDMSYELVSEMYFVYTYTATRVTFSSKHRYSAGSPVTADVLLIHLSCGNSSAHGIRRSPPLKVPPVGLLRSTLRAEKCSMTSVTKPVENAAVERYPDEIHVTGDEYDRIHP